MNTGYGAIAGRLSRSLRVGRAARRAVPPEFTQHDHGSPGPAPGRDNLLVLYFDDLTQMEQVATRLATLGHLPVEAENPYWTENGAVTVEDPDRWRVVLMPQSLVCLVDAVAMIGLACLPTSPPHPMSIAARRCLMRVTMTTCWPIRSTWSWGLKGWPRDALMSRKKKGRCWLAARTVDRPDQLGRGLPPRLDAPRHPRRR